MRKTADYLARYWVLILAVIGTVSGFTNVAFETIANAKDILKVDQRVDKYEEKIDKLIKITERIDERTQRR